MSVKWKRMVLPTGQKLDSESESKLEGQFNIRIPDLKKQKNKLCNQ